MNFPVIAVSGVLWRMRTIITLLAGILFTSLAFAANNDNSKATEEALSGHMSRRPAVTIFETTPTGCVFLGISLLICAGVVLKTVVQIKTTSVPRIYFPLCLTPALIGIAFAFMGVRERIRIMGQTGFANIETTASFYYLPATGCMVSLILYLIGFVLLYFSSISSRRKL